MNDLYKNTNNAFYLPELDGLRFFAFLLVFIHHNLLFSKTPFLSSLQTHGWIGVDLFFALSAFLFSKLLVVEYNLTQTINFKKFYLRRIFRIWPVYYLLIGFSIAVIIYSTSLSLSNLGIRILGLVTFTDNIFTAFQYYNPVPYSRHLWTISFEEQFYIVVPFIILFLAKSTKRIKVITFVCCILIFTMIRMIFISINAPYPSIWVLPITHFESILFGIVIGFGGFDFLLKKINPLLLAAIGIAAFISLSYLPDIGITNHWSNLTYLVVGITTSLFVFAVISSEALKRFFTLPFFVFLGKRSYGLYLYHFVGNAFAKMLVEKFSFLPSNHLALFTYSLLFTVAASIFSYKYIETYFLKLKKKFEVIKTRPI